MRVCIFVRDLWGCLMICIESRELVKGKQVKLDPEKKMERIQTDG